jgi:hypothetical protein
MEPTHGGREIRDVALLDLTGAHAAGALDGVTRISHVATILVPESLVPKLSTIPMDRVATMVPVPDGQRVKVMSGQIVLSGEALSAPGQNKDDMVIVAGQLIITSPVTQVGCRDLVVLGQVIAPTGSETALGAGLSRLTGQVVYYPYVTGATMRMTSANTLAGEALANLSGDPTDILLAPTGGLVVTGQIERIGYTQVIALGHLLVPQNVALELLGRFTSVTGQVARYTAPPRMFDGRDHFSAGFFELFDEPITLVLDGKFSFDDDVPPELLRRAVATIVLDGRIRAPKRLVPMLQMLCTIRDGEIVTLDEAE